VLMGADQLAVGLAVSTRHLRLPTTIRGLFELFAQAFSRGLKQIGLRAEFVGKNDIQIDGKKIAGLAISQDEKNAVFFHASVLLDFDLRLMLDVLNLPRPGSLDTSISCFGDRMATLRQYSAALSIDELEAVLLRALEETFSVGIVEDGVSEWERSTIAELMRTRYSQDEWIFFRRAPRRRCGVARRKTAGGLIEVHLALLGDAIETVLITGSFFGRIRDVSRLESVVRWQNANAEGIGAIVQQAMRESGVYRVSAEEVADVIMEAAESARNESRGKTTSSAQALA
jgi:lipoate-protein ligase A